MENISERDFIKEETIYKTSTVEVFKARIIQTGRPVVAKKLKVNSIEEVNFIQKESYTMVSLQHPNIVELLACFLSGNGTSIEYAFFIMDYYPKGDLSKEIKRRSAENRPWSENELLYHIKSLIDAHCWLQNRGIAHRDIKPGNIFVSDKGDLLVADLGCAYKSTRLKRGDSEFTIAGTPVYLSPKLREAYVNLCNGIGNDTAEHNPIKSDVYSLGLTFLYMASLSDLSDLMDLRTHESKVRKKIQDIRYSDIIKGILTQMLIFDEGRRPDFVWLSNSLASLYPSKTQTNSPQNQLIRPAQSMTNIQQQECKSVKIKANKADMNYLFRNKQIKIWVKQSCLKNYLYHFLNSILAQIPTVSSLSDFIALAKSTNTTFKVSSLSYKCIFCNLSNCDTMFSCKHYGPFHKQCVDKNYIYCVDNENTRMYQISCGQCNQVVNLWMETISSISETNGLNPIYSQSYATNAYTTNQTQMQNQYAGDVYASINNSEDIELKTERCGKCKETKTVLVYPSCRHKMCKECIAYRNEQYSCCLCPMQCSENMNKKIWEYINSFNS